MFNNITGERRERWPANSLATAKALSANSLATAKALSANSTLLRRTTAGQEILEHIVSLCLPTSLLFFNVV
jgi:hypothetical protein